MAVTFGVFVPVMPTVLEGRGAVWDFAGANGRLVGASGGRIFAELVSFWRSASSTVLVFPAGSVPAVRWNLLPDVELKPFVLEDVWGAAPDVAFRDLFAD